ncbi:AlpA family phage regulatory protein [uncultured Cardiobacterium sp.]|jgi:hypothetical protein|uniref:helix-turn-helix transcriptional regulator n=1 Tax=uncultured Cardiobacterium sp. TaxID=417619 RepID=UPI00261E4C8E|nr:AlpA family phage regulatory protein [uncultured Cardiobacterium sp.]
MKMLKCEQVAEIIGCSRSTLYERIINGSFPDGIKRGNAKRWPDYVAYAWNILYWGLNEPLPEMAEETLKEVRSSVEIAKQLLSA